MSENSKIVGKLGRKTRDLPDSLMTIEGMSFIDIARYHENKSKITSVGEGYSARDPYKRGGRFNFDVLITPLPIHFFLMH